MSFIKSTFKTHAAEAVWQHVFDLPSIKTFFFSLSSRRNILIDRRIKKISEQGTSPEWWKMTPQEKTSLIYKNMATAKAIERLERMKN
jgi:hypothetical protein